MTWRMPLQDRWESGRLTGWRTRCTSRFKSQRPQVSNCSPFFGAKATNYLILASFWQTFVRFLVLGMNAMVSVCLFWGWDQTFWWDFGSFFAIRMKWSNESQVTSFLGSNFLVWDDFRCWNFEWIDWGAASQLRQLLDFYFEPFTLQHNRLPPQSGRDLELIGDWDGFVWRKFSWCVYIWLYTYDCSTVCIYIYISLFLNIYI